MDEPHEPLFSNDSKWPENLIYRLESELVELSKTIPLRLTEADEAQLRARHVLYAIRRILLSESGMDGQELLSLIGDDQFGWTKEKNGRRFLLIDKEVDGSISADEAYELESLTLQMRYALKETQQTRVDEAKKLFEEISNSAQQARNENR